MPGISDTSETSILALIFQAVLWTNYASGTAAVLGSPETTILVGLHTADPGETGTMATSEVTTGQYNSYARVAVARTTGGWAVSSPSGVGTISPVADISFAACASGTGCVVNNFSTGHSGAAGTAQPILFFGTVTPTITVAAGVTPSLTTATTITLD